MRKGKGSSVCYSSEECRATAFLCDRVSAPDAAGSGLFLLPFCGEAGKVKELVTRISYIYLRKGKNIKMQNRFVAARKQEVRVE